MTHPARVLVRALVVLLTAGSLALLPSSAHAVAGAQTSGDPLFPNVGNGGYDVSHYDLDVVWTAPTVPGSPGPLGTDSIAAVTTITAATTGAPLSSFSLDLEGLTVSSVTVDGVAAAHARITDAAATKHKLVVTPAAPVSGTFTTVVTYSGTPVSHTDADGSSEGWGRTSDGVIFLNQPVGAMTGFPNNNTPGDKATYDISLDIPSTILGQAAAAVSNGELASRTVTGDRTTWRWVQAEQMATMAVLISIGRYTTYDTDIQLASGRTIRELSFIDPLASGASGAVTARSNLKSYLDFFETRYGPYPGNSTGIVVDNISPTAGINYALETQDRAFFPNSVGATTNIHEAMHQWWGDGVSPKVWDDIWISEGAASFAEVLYPNEGASPPTSTTTTESANYDRWNSTAAASANWTVPPADMGDSAELFGWQTYHRSEMTFEALKAAIGTADFDTVMLEWNQRYNGQSPGTAAFIALAEEIDGRQLDAFFADWIYEPDKPAWPSKFTLSLTSSPATGPVAPGAAVTYTVSAANTGKVALTGAVVTVDLADVLDDATLDGSPQAGTTLDGTTLTWTVPSTPVAGTATISLPVTVSGAVSSATLGVSTQASATTLGSTCDACASTLQVLENPVSPSSVPTIDDATPQVGQSLTATLGSWDPAATLTYQWRADGAPVGTDSAAYAVQPADVGKLLTVSVTGSRGGYQSVTQTSAATAAVALGDQVLTPVPTVSGTAQVDRTLVADPGTWDPGVTLAYQWAVDGAAVPGATSTSYVVRPADLGRPLTFTVTGTRAGFTTVSRTSAPTSPVVSGTLASSPVPTIRGRAKVRRTLRVEPGPWQPGVVLTYQWFVGPMAVAGADGTTFRVRKAHLGKRVRVMVTGTKPGYTSVTMASRRTAKVV